MQKMERKRCDLIVLNGPDAINAADTSVEVFGKDGVVLGTYAGSKTDTATMIVETIQKLFIKNA
jgi:phosphopantothenoylcysteine decarboxylase/phosphopantothenate--cysteine ligase